LKGQNEASEATGSMERPPEINRRIRAVSGSERIWSGLAHYPGIRFPQACDDSPPTYIRPVHPSSDFFEPEKLRVTVDRVLYQPQVMTPADRPHCFVYFISIHNDTDSTVTIKGRKWVVTNKRGEVTAVEGEGVVGQQPTIEPGEKFSYNSFHLLDAESAVAEGSYLGIDGEGRKVITRIPPFHMSVPKV
jgi:ApaG protein